MKLMDQHLNINLYAKHMVDMQYKNAHLFK